jgi:cyclopropane fatty-acyl-phospholipid synthase-like methyltransferase
LLSQVITRQDEGYAEYCKTSDFIRAHIFPGGHLPCMAAMVDAAARAPTQLVVSDCLDIGPDYAVTLHEWRRRWNEKHSELLALGYDDVFIRKYDFYFAYCEAAFAVKYIHDYIITWKRAADTAGGVVRSSSGSEVAGASSLYQVGCQPTLSINQV